MKNFFRIILLLINLFFVALLLFSTMAGWVRPTRCIWFSLFSYGYFLLLLGNLFFILLWMLLRRKAFLLSLLAIVVRCSFVPLFCQVGGSAEAPAPQEGESQLRVLSFNVHGFNGATEGEHNQDTNALQFLSMVRNEAPDVLCLQEFPVPNKVKVGDSLVRMGYRHHFSVGVSGKGYHQGTTLYSKLPIEYIGKLDNHNKFFVDLTTSDTTHLRLFCVHFDSYSLDTNDKGALKELSHGQMGNKSQRFVGKFRQTIYSHEEEWDRLKPLIEEATVPVVVAGDFNDTPSSYLYQQVRTLLADSFVDQGKGFSTTYHGPFPAFRIDYIFHSESLTTLSYQRLKSNISDHYPVMAVFAL